MNIRNRWVNQLWNDERGLTLIEGMIGLLVFTVGVTAVYSMIVLSFGNYADARQSTQEVNAMALSIEPLKHSGYDNDNVLQDDDETPGTGPLYAPGSQSYIEYRAQNNAVVSGTKLIVMQNDRVLDNPNVPVYTLRFTKPEIR